MKTIIFSIVLILPVLLISTIPASFAPSHPVGGLTTVDPLSTFTCERDSEGNLINPLAPTSFCDEVNPPPQRIIDQFGIMLIVGTIIVAGILVFIVIRRK